MNQCMVERLPGSRKTAVREKVVGRMVAAEVTSRKNIGTKDNYHSQGWTSGSAE